MAWIESHQALGHHPKTQALGSTLRCGLPTAVGYLHYLWWWALDYAQGGGIPASQLKVAARACQWRGEPARFWAALQKAGFVEIERDGSVTIHDWMEYAGRLVDRRQKNTERMRRVRSTRAHDAHNPNAHVRGYQPDQPDQPPVGPLTTTLRPHAREPGPEGPLAARSNGAVEDEPPRLPNGAQQCPLCPDVFTSSYDEHLATSPRHKFRPEPEDFSGKRTSPESPEPGPSLTMAEALAQEHERLLALDRARQQPLTGHVSKSV